MSVLLVLEEPMSIFERVDGSSASLVVVLVLDRFEESTREVALRAVVALVTQRSAMPASSSTIWAFLLDVTDFVANVAPLGVLTRCGPMASGTAESTSDGTKVDCLNRGVRMGATRNFGSTYWARPFSSSSSGCHRGG
jgi:hypothetical protein